jgi:hypothetical protein
MVVFGRAQRWKVTNLLYQPKSKHFINVIKDNLGNNLSCHSNL